MPHQENPNIRFINVRVTQELYMLAEKRAEEHKTDISGLVRMLLLEKVAGMELTSDDYAELAKRTKEREKKLNA